MAEEPSMVVGAVGTKEAGEFSPPHRIPVPGALEPVMSGVAHSHGGASTGSGGNTSSSAETRKGSYENFNNSSHVEGAKALAPAPPG